MKKEKPVTSFSYNMLENARLAANLVMVATAYRSIHTRYEESPIFSWGVMELVHAKLDSISHEANETSIKENCRFGKGPKGPKASWDYTSEMS